MRHGQTMRNYAKAFFAFAAISMVGACADQNVSAPTVGAKSAAFKAPANYLTIGTTTVFTVNNSTGAIQRIEDHVLAVPAGAICALNSTYGSTEWDKPCTPLSGSVTFTATVLQGPDGEPFIDFQPSVRFSPTKQVMLFFKNTSTKAGTLAVVYCNNLGTCHDESLSDASLKPFRVGTTSMIGRRVKHFSSYTVWTVDECPSGNVTIEGDGTIWCHDGGLARKSGYMVASGQREEGDKDAEREGKEEKDKEAEK
jgi:hypothetical protein